MSHQALLWPVNNNKRHRLTLSYRPRHYEQFYAKKVDLVSTEEVADFRKNTP